MNTYVFATDAGWIGGVVVVVAENGVDAQVAAATEAARFTNYKTDNPAIVVGIIGKLGGRYEGVLTASDGEY